MNMNTLRRKPDTRTLVRWVGGIVLPLALLAAGCQPRTASSPSAPDRKVEIDVSCNKLPVVGVYFFALRKDGTVVRRNFAPWAPKNGDPTSAVAAPEVPSDTTAMRIDVGCGGDEHTWGINSHQSAVEIYMGSKIIAACPFTKNDLPVKPDAGTLDVADVCRVSVQPVATPDR